MFLGKVKLSTFFEKVANMSSATTVRFTFTAVGTGDPTVTTYRGQTSYGTEYQNIYCVVPIGNELSCEHIPFQMYQEDGRRVNTYSIGKWDPASPLESFKLRDEASRITGYAEMNGNLYTCTKNCIFMWDVNCNLKKELRTDVGCMTVWNGKIYVGDIAQCRVFVYDKNLNFIGLISLEEDYYFGISAIAVCRDHLFVAAKKPNDLFKISKEHFIATRIKLDGEVSCMIEWNGNLILGYDNKICKYDYVTNQITILTSGFGASAFAKWNSCLYVGFRDSLRAWNSNDELVYEGTEHIKEIQTLTVWNDQLCIGGKGTIIIRDKVY